ncbi:MAG: MmgE/PrpD family protein [Proteobacteria bacterium]|nr:MmgE/PrpD family protein [Pseudomonadota bacterium]
MLGDGFRTSAPWAAYANGTLAHAIDYDDINPQGDTLQPRFFPPSWQWGRRWRLRGKRCSSLTY